MVLPFPNLVIFITYMSVNLKKDIFHLPSFNFYYSCGSNVCYLKHCSDHSTLCIKSTVLKSQPTLTNTYGRLQSTESQRVGHNRSDLACMHHVLVTFTGWGICSNRQDSCPYKAYFLVGKLDAKPLIKHKIC